MKRNNKKGFTIVELVIVIAVIVILAAVLIPTFASIIKKADTSADIQMVKTLNTIVVAEGVADGGIKTAHDAIAAVSKNGYDLEHITPTADGRTIVWDGANYRFALLDEDGKEIYPKDDKSGTPKANLFVVSDTYHYNGFAVYLTEAYAGSSEISVTTGIDVGYNDQITKITYTGTDAVAIRGAEHTTIVVNSGTVHHYDVAWTAYVADGAEYIEHGTLNSPVKDGAPAATAFAGGSGTEDDPYLIASVEQLQSELFESTTNSYHYKLIADIDLSKAEVVNSYGSDAMVGKYFYNSTFDGNGHTITVSGNGGLFRDVESSTIKNLTLNFNESSNYSTLTMYLTSSVIENVTTEGSVDELYPNCGLLSYNTSGKCQFIGCTNNANIDGYSGKNISIFGGLLQTNAEAVYEDCVNNGFVKGAQVGMFASCTNNGSKLTITNCKNEGCINFMAQYKSSTYGGFVPESYYAGNKSFQLASLTVDGVVKEVITSEAIAGTGICVYGTTEVFITLNEDKTFTIELDGSTPAYYEISAGVWRFSDDGSSLRYYATEKITCDGSSSCVTEMKLIPFVNSDDSNYTDAGELAGNPVKKDAQGSLYYACPVTTRDGKTYKLNNSVVNIVSVTVTAKNADGDVIGIGTYAP